MKKSTGKKLQLTLVRTEDILAALGRKKRSQQYLVGFAAETRRLLQNARKKLRDKGLDLIVANSVDRGRGFAANSNEATLLLADGRVFKLARQTKQRLAERILNRISLDCTRSTQGSRRDLPAGKRN